jgi:hypothetical protein
VPKKKDCVALSTDERAMAAQLLRHGYLKAAVIWVVMNNFNTHKPASLDKTFAPAEFRYLLTL